MPKRKDIKKILIIGSGPIIIGQACEFDYSGTQACKALREEGYEVVLVNSNPATIMTDPNVANRTYIEPITADVLEKIIQIERPDACLPTMGGQTGLNQAVEAYERGIFTKYGVEMIGVKYEAIKKAEDRSAFHNAMQKIGLDLPRSECARSVEDALEIAKTLGFPVIVRPSFTLGGSGSGICYNEDDLKRVARLGLEYSMVKEVLIEESVIGWKEFELEVMRDCKDNFVVICSIENFDPMGIHTGDSITVAPAQTLTDKEYQRMRDAARKIISEIGVETGGSNIQFAVHPETGRLVVIEMNPRVSRSSALASKATGFPIAKFAAKLAVGLTLDEIPNDITKYTPAGFEPSIDYCVVKIPRFAFEKFEGVNDTLGTQMKSVGETMALGRTFKEAFQKGMRGLEIKRMGFGCDGRDDVFGLKLESRETLVQFIEGAPRDEALRRKILERIKIPRADRIFYIKYAFYAGYSAKDIFDATKVDIWFLEQLRQIIDLEKELLLLGNKPDVDSESFRQILKQAKRYGFSDFQIGFCFGKKDLEIRKLRKSKNIESVYKLVDTCAAEFKAFTPYFYSTYEDEDETIPSAKRKVMILGGGPNRIGQGIEFDYCCVQAAIALRGLGYETIMVNSNPETVSTDYDTSDKLFFEPVTLEDILNIADREKPCGVIVQLGGQTPLNLCKGLEENGLKILGTSTASIDFAEDRQKFRDLLERIGVHQPKSEIVFTPEEAIVMAKKVGYPVLIRPSYVLGGRAMEIVYDEEQLRKYIVTAVEASDKNAVLIDKFLEDAIEIDVDLIGDGETYVVGGILEHIEEAGVHSGDAAMALPPFSLSKEKIDELVEKTKKIAAELKVVGLMNVQYAIQHGQIYCLEVNPRASRTVPFVSKAIGVPLAKLAAQVMVGKTLRTLGFSNEVIPPYFSIKESVFPFVKFPGVDIILSPEMKSTGEVMGIDEDFGLAYYKAQVAAYSEIPMSGKIFLSVMESDKAKMLPIAKKLIKQGYQLITTQGTGAYLAEHGIESERVKKISEGEPNITDRIRAKEVALVINTPTGKGPMQDEAKIRSLAVSFNVPCVTTINAARAVVQAIDSFREKGLSVKPLQAYLKSVGAKAKFSCMM
ncbi:MAG: carbamoyl phosphate synthase large subunit [Omnitrophica bacterium RIFCSPLOWO2_12_FULL_44_17]|uniref:Carbamoyl phosphate synthase large chain n=1 Tax=Candidatus Danuiimicrobium aquiferis TaxID=1801832 RepID=A0A1G1KRQ1_9BACT|nr:MAG: carbamoyl phosphate synthase large subunit [Omnitrophica bacterium RIFCSPHIGHO2_02_FULL_45_28]OGW91881.1 MAG: carbamoyl phosphate synthase large subunit [Omnitrophica bacterium RIFCSPHIGHO2_12_FULL_44_12]OGW95593.1 MAG: carbamoyl phosphate synthase large subunit [Omnitrophica bacterium RIFCSPLOWO2_12_FULL_44_17]OGX03692.1 MAG: carbamoyl phosphate synthase large subunit [Omnitrophica bacterium RIFCSPLOWO2_02_FULL_44_11]